MGVRLERRSIGEFMGMRLLEEVAFVAHWLEIASKGAGQGEDGRQRYLFHTG